MAVSKKITKKAISAKVKSQPEKGKRVSAADVKIPQKRGCTFCQNKTKPAYDDVVTLRKYISDRGKIIPKVKSGICSKHQRQVTRAIKYARHLALLPFTPKI